MSQEQTPDPEQKPARPRVVKPRMLVLGKGNIIGDFNSVVQHFNSDPRLRWYLLGLAVLIAASGLALYFLLRPAPYNQTPMDGNFNIAVANFSVEGQSAGSDLGMAIARVVHSNLEANLGDLAKTYLIRTRGPDEVERVKGSPEERLASVDRIAKSIQADLVVYGTVKTDGLEYTITPRFYINPDRLPEEKEVTGPYTFGQDLVVYGPAGPAFNEDLGAQMAERMRVLTLISTGLSFYGSHRYEQALERFQLAEAEPWPEGMKREILYLLTGNAAGKTGQYDLAETYYRSALAEDPEYARARLGMGSLSFIRALLVYNQSQDPADIDPDLLRDSLQTFQSALEAENKPAEADIEIKAHLYIGQCYFFQAYSADALDLLEPAMQEFQAVTQSYEQDPNPRIQELAGEAYGHQGLIYRLLDQPQDAIQAYQQAVKLMAVYPQRQKMYQQRLDELLSQ